MSTAFLRDVTTSLAALAVTCFFAWRGDWTAADILWSLWISSLVLGYLTILFGVRNMARMDVRDPQTFLRGLGRQMAEQAIRRPASVETSAGAGDVASAGQPLPVALRLGMPLFLIAFFSVHFIGFHYGHSIFLNDLFSLIDEKVHRAGNAGWLTVLIPVCLVNYWPVVLASALTQRHHFLAALRGNAVSLFTAPYGTVIKLHCTIMALGFLSIFGVGEPILLVLLIFYFLPLMNWFREWRQGAQLSTRTPVDQGADA